MSTDERLVVCCKEFRDAMQEGTDNEGYGKLIFIEEGRYATGDHLPAINFCPWCGTSLEKP